MQVPREVKKDRNIKEKIGKTTVLGTYFFNTFDWRITLIEGKYIKIDTLEMIIFIFKTIHHDK